MLTIFHHPLPGIHDEISSFPKLYLVGYFIAIIIGLVFLSYFGIKFSGESKRRSDAVNKLQQVIAKEYELRVTWVVKQLLLTFTRNTIGNYQCCLKRIKKRNRE